MTIYEANFVPCMRTTASLTSLSVSGMDRTGEIDFFFNNQCTHLSHFVSNLPLLFIPPQCDNDRLL